MASLCTAAPSLKKIGKGTPPGYPFRFFGGDGAALHRLQNGPLFGGLYTKGVTFGQEWSMTGKRLDTRAEPPSFLHTYIHTQGNIVAFCCIRRGDFHCGIERTL